MFFTELSRATSDARAFRQLHEATLVLPNAWDAMSAAVIANAGAAAVATSSGGVSWSRGVPDGEHLTRDEAVELAHRELLSDGYLRPVDGTLDGKTLNALVASH